MKLLGSFTYEEGSWCGHEVASREVSAPPSGHSVGWPCVEGHTHRKFCVSRDYSVHVKPDCVVARAAASSDDDDYVLLDSTTTNTTTTTSSSGYSSSTSNSPTNLGLPRWLALRGRLNCQEISCFSEIIASVQSQPE